MHKWQIAVKTSTVALSFLIKGEIQCELVNGPVVLVLSEGKRSRKLITPSWIEQSEVLITSVYIHVGVDDAKYPSEKPDEH